MDEILKQNNIMLKIIITKLNIQQQQIINLQKRGTCQEDLISYLNGKFPNERKINFKQFATIIMDNEDLMCIYKQNTINDLICNKISRIIHTFDGIKCISACKYIFIKTNDNWRKINTDDIMRIISYIKIAAFNRTKLLPTKTLKDRTFVDKIDQIISKPPSDILITIVKKSIYNAITE